MDYNGYYSYIMLSNFSLTQIHTTHAQVLFWHQMNTVDPCGSMLDKCATFSAMHTVHVLSDYFVLFFASVCVSQC